MWCDSTSHYTVAALLSEEDLNTLPNPYVNKCTSHRVLTFVLSGDLCARDYLVSEASPLPIST